MPQPSLTVLGPSPPFVFSGVVKGEWLLEVLADDGMRALGIRWDGSYEVSDPSEAARLFAEALIPYLQSCFSAGEA